MKKLTVTLMSVFFFASMLISSSLNAQESDLYSEGHTVWNLTFVKLKANMGDDYLKGEEFQKTVSSYSTLREITGRKTMREIFLN